MKKYITFRILVEEKTKKRKKILSISSKDLVIYEAFHITDYKRLEPRIELKIVKT